MNLVILVICLKNQQLKSTVHYPLTGRFGVKAPSCDEPCRRMPALPNVHCSTPALVRRM